ncbi:sialin-like [Anneissia japonica]|uniref:sialin-like n=1 Tax=Anneissia japonica TaxID=1529436 RepID=UPI001425BA82|nr:sialin-like [Anneissia japonica]
MKKKQSLTKSKYTIPMANKIMIMNMFFKGFYKHNNYRLLVQSRLLLKTNFKQVQTLDWDEKTQQMILGAFFYGYTLMPIPGGWLARNIGGKRMIGFSIICSSILSALIPWATGVSVGLTVTLRILDGLAQGNVIPATVVLLQNWAPKSELNTMISIAFAGRKFTRFAIHQFFVKLKMYGLIMPKVELKE